MARRHSTADYHNFRDPIGCAWRMVRKARYESIWPLAQAATAAIARPLDAVAARWEQDLVNYSAHLPAHSDSAADQPIQLLVAGSPRSGSTVVSQLLARHLNVSYFPNVSALFPNAPIWSTKKWLDNFKSPPRSLKSFYGNTVGFSGVNDGFHIWNRWFGHNRYCIDHHPTADEVMEMRSFFASWAAAFPLPLLNKNNRNIDGLELLANLLPSAIFVIVQRDPMMVVQSLQRARQFVQGSDAYAWGLFGEDAVGDDSIESICRQVAFIRRRTKEQLERISSDRWLTIQYEDFCSAPDEVIYRLRDLVPTITARPGIPAAQPLTASCSVSLPESTIRRVNESLTRFENEPLETRNSGRRDKPSSRVTAQK